MRIGTIVKKLSEFVGKRITQGEVKEEVENSGDEEKKKGNIVMNPLFIIFVRFLMLLSIAAIVSTIVLYFLSTAPKPIMIPIWVWAVLYIIYIILIIRQIYTKYWQLVPSEPPIGPCVALATIWGKRKEIVIEEGWHLFAPFFPLLYEGSMINIVKRNVDLKFPDLRAREEEEPGKAEKKESAGSEKKTKEESEGKKKKPRAGGELELEVHYTYQPDYKSKNAGKQLIRFMNSGEDDGVENIIKDQIAEELRGMASENDWESFTFSKGEIKKALVKRLTGKKLTPKIEKEINGNGVPDIYDLGIRICRFNVGRIKEQGELAKAAEAKATQKQKIKGALVELDFLKEQTKGITTLGVPAPTALNAVQVQMNKAEKKVNVYEGLDKGTEVVGLVIAQLLDRVGSPRDSGEKKKQE